MVLKDSSPGKSGHSRARITGILPRIVCVESALFAKAPRGPAHLPPEGERSSPPGVTMAYHHTPLGEEQLLL